MQAIADASEVDLVYVDEKTCGLVRRGRGRGFSYHEHDGDQVRDEATLARIRSLAIPPAWTDVWICPLPEGHLQATGRDARGRKQYLYHPAWTARRDETKYERLAEIGRLLPGLRRRVDADLKQPLGSRPRVLATVARLLETTLIRIGSREYARCNDSYGLTTLRDDHVEVAGTEMRFEFRGKSGKSWRLAVADRRIANAVRTCQALPGQTLFQYVDQGQRHTVTAADVNAYLREAAGAELSAKDIRTWAGTVVAAAELARCEPPQSPSHAKRLLSAAVKRVAARLGNTPAVCRKSYVHPAVPAAWQEGRLHAAFARSGGLRGLGREEQAVLRLIEASPACAPAHRDQRGDRIPRMTEHAA